MDGSNITKFERNRELSPLLFAQHRAIIEIAHSSESRMTVSPRYTHTAVALHWLIALMIIGAFSVGLYMTSIEGLSILKLKLYAWHKWIGVTIFALVWVRLVWRLIHGAPAPVAGTPAWQARAAHLAHGVLYVLMVAVPLTGYLMSQASGIPVVYFGVWEMPALLAADEGMKATLQLAHAWLNYVMAGIVTLHIAAALQHHFLHRDGTLARMLPFLKS
jgi:cytochrome b561